MRRDTCREYVELCLSVHIRFSGLMLILTVEVAVTLDS